MRHAEDLVVAKRQLETGRVKVEVRTETTNREIEEPLASERVEIERVAIDRIVETTPEIRQEGDVTIFPVMEEVLVTERRLVLKEEVRIRRVRVVEVHRETVRLSHQVAHVTRTPSADAQGMRADQTHTDISGDIL